MSDDEQALRKLKPVLLGYAIVTRALVYLSYLARRLGTYIIGMAGMGKTTLLLYLVMQDIVNGHGVCVIDPQGKWVEDIIARIPPEREKDVIYLNPADKVRPVGLNLFECTDPDDDDMVDLVMSQVVKGVFEEIWGDMEQMPRMADVLRVACRTLIRCQSIPDPRLRPTLVEMPRLLRDEDYRRFLLDHIHRRYPESEIELLRWWDEYEAKGAYRQNEQVASTLNKVQEFAQSAMVKRIVGQNVSTIDFRRAMDDGMIVLVNLSEGEIGREVAALIGALVISRIHIAARSRVELIKLGLLLRRFHLLVDEFQNFAIKAFAKLQDECRQYAIDITIAHQNRSGQLADERQVQASTLNMTNWIVFRTNPVDATVLATGFKTAPPKPEARGQREPLGFASYPWDALKRQAHEKQAVRAQLHKIDSWLTIGQKWEISSWQKLKEVGIKERQVMLKESNQYLTSRRYGQSTYSLIYQEYLYVKGFGNEQMRDSFVKALNRYLALVMMEEGKEDAEALLADVSERLFGGAVVLDEGSSYTYSHTARETTNNPPLAPDRGKTALAGLRAQMNQKAAVYEKGRARWAQGGSSAESVLNDLWSLVWSQIYYARAAMRVYLMEQIAQLGALLRQYPVFIRGGQPVTEYERPRSIADIAAERADQLVHLPQFEALCRIQEGHEFVESHIKIANAYEIWPKRADDPTERIIAASRQKYGRDRIRVEQELALRATSIREKPKDLPQVWDE